MSEEYNSGNVESKKEGFSHNTDIKAHIWPSGSRGRIILRVCSGVFSDRKKGLISLT